MLEIWVIGWVAGGLAQLALHGTGRVISGDPDEHAKVLGASIIVAFLFCGIPALNRIIAEQSNRLRTAALTLVAVPAPLVLIEMAILLIRLASTES